MLSLSRPVSIISSAHKWHPYFLFLKLGDDDEEEGGEEGEEGGEAEEKMPTCGDYIMHFLTLFWKILFAFIPPAGELYLISAQDCNIFKSMPSAALCLFFAPPPRRSFL